MDNSCDAADNCRDTVVMNCDERFAVLRSIGDEFIYEDELRVLLKKKSNPICYVWFEPSPMMDIEQGIMKTIYVNKMIKAGFTVKILMADWFLQRHYKIGSNLSKIGIIGYYNIEMWKAAGMNLDRVEVVWFSDELNLHAVNYWPVAMDVSKRYTVKRMARTCGHTGPYGPQILPAAEIFCPCVQVAAILCEKADVWLFSMDHRDIVKLAKDYCEDINRVIKPAIVLHNTLPNLLEDPEFTNERDPGRTIFMQDERDTLDTKISWAFCPPKVVECNPCLEYIKYVVLPWFGKLEVVHNEGNGTTKTFVSMEELSVDYESGCLNCADVKLAFEKAMNDILEPVRDYFSSNTEAQALIIGRKLQNERTADVWKIISQNEGIDNY